MGDQVIDYATDYAERSSWEGRVRVQLGDGTWVWDPPIITDLDDYQKRAMAFDMSSHHGLPYYTLGLAGEAGEVSEKVKKLLRDDEAQLTEERAEAIFKELGDVLWYAAAIARYLGRDLSQVAQSNIDKLASRQSRGVLQGSGDDR